MSRTAPQPTHRLIASDRRVRGPRFEGYAFEWENAMWVDALVFAAEARRAAAERATS